MEQKWTEFGGVAGRVLLKSISGSSFVTGIVLGLFLLVGDWALMMAQAPEMTMPFNQVVLAAALARFALNGLYGEWNGTVFSSVGGSLGQVALISGRYLALTAIWLVPTFLLAPRPDDAAMMAGMGPQLSGGLITALMVYMLAMTLTPPLFLIVALSADRFADCFKPDHWSAQFSGRMGDLFSIYVVYTGTLGMVVVLAIAPVLLAVNIAWQFGAFVGAVLFCLVFGMSVNLLGRLCGFYVCGDLGMLEPESPSARAPRSPAAPVQPIGADFDPAPTPATVAPVSAPASLPVSVPVATAVQPATVQQSAGAGPAAQKKPPLLDSKERVEAAVKRFATDPAGAISALRDLGTNYAPHPHVMEALTVCLHRAGDVEGAIAMANTALPLCFERGHSYLAARIFKEMHSRMDRLGLDREKLIAIGGALNKMGDLSGAAKAFSTVIEADAGEPRAVKGLLNVADRIARETPNLEAAARVYRYLVERCPQSPLMEHIRLGLGEAERKLAEQTPAGV